MIFTWKPIFDTIITVSNAMTRAVHHFVLSQRAPAAEKEQRMIYGKKPLSSTSEPARRVVGWCDRSSCYRARV
jgi:hypothetical protein